MRAELAAAEAIALVLACAYRRGAMTAVANVRARIGGSGGSAFKEGRVNRLRRAVYTKNAFFLTKFPEN